VFCGDENQLQVFTHQTPTDVSSFAHWLVKYSCSFTIGVFMKRLILSLSIVASALAVMSPAQAVGRVADVDVVERHTGRTLPVHFFRGEYWVEGTPGVPYAVRVRNATGERLLAVMSVDGVNVLSGETAAITQSGYVFEAGRQSDIAGWRKSNSEIAAFEFTASPNSYAERTGRPADVGVIGVAVFRERPVPAYVPQPAPWPGYNGRNERYQEKSGSAAPGQGKAEMHNDSYRGAPQAQAQAAPRLEPKLGTGHGARETSVVSNTTFERASSEPTEVIRIRYDSHENLVGMGVLREWRGHRQDPRPNAFPESRVSRGYVPDPPHWR
jgi:hypothetical protein